MESHGHLRSYQCLITPYEEVRAGFVSMALEKNKKATPLVESAKALKVFAERAKTPKGLLRVPEIQDSLLTAAGISDKAKGHLHQNNKNKAVADFIDNFLKPAGKGFVDELVYRFLLTKGDSLGGSIRNLAGALGEKRFTVILTSTLFAKGISFSFLSLKERQWVNVVSPCEQDMNQLIKGLSWEANGENRVLIYNLTVPMVKKNVDLCLFSCAAKEIIFGEKNSAHCIPERYLALGELKGGIDPAGADEHWKTANSALGRIRKAFAEKRLKPLTFFIGAAIENAMAKEMYRQLEEGHLSNVANLTNEKQMVSLCDWLSKI